MTKTCHYCDAKLWPTETSSLYCANGQINLPLSQHLPEPLHQLFVAYTAEYRRFRNNIRSYNSAFAFASLGVNEDMLPAGVYCFRVRSTVCHRIGHLQSNIEGEGAKFAQLYRYICLPYCIHSTHCANNNKRLSSPIHIHKETVSNKIVLRHDYKQVTGSNFDKSWNLSSTVSFHSWSVVCNCQELKAIMVYNLHSHRHHITLWL